MIREEVFPDGRILRSWRPPDWRADAWHLERRYPQRWGRCTRVDLSVPLTELEQLARAMAVDCGMPLEDVLQEAQVFLQALWDSIREPDQQSAE